MLEEVVKQSFLYRQNETAVKIKNENIRASQTQVSTQSQQFSYPIDFMPWIEYYAHVTFQESINMNISNQEKAINAIIVNDSFSDTEDEDLDIDVNVSNQEKAIDAIIGYDSFSDTEDEDSDTVSDTFSDTEDEDSIDIDILSDIHLHSYKDSFNGLLYFSNTGSETLIRPNSEKRQNEENVDQLGFSSNS
jgi:hypothetical protein